MKRTLSVRLEKETRRRKRQEKKREQAKAKRRASELTCKSKIRHLSRQSALTEIKALAQRGLATPTTDFYRCEFCKGYHVTTGAKQDERA